MLGRYLEDFVAGSVHHPGSARITADEIIAFGREFDPQPFHVDSAAGSASPFGSLIASGWHTAAIAQRLLVGAFPSDAVTFGSPGVDELRFLRPVRPEDTLSLRVTVLETRPSASKPDRGVLRIRTEMLNQRGEVVLSMIGLSIFGRRPNQPGTQPESAP
jgi:acyl dehydratase